MSANRLRDARVAWVTGASSGIGREVAIRLARRGIAVAVSARSADALAALALELPGIHTFPLDVSDHDASAATIARIEAELGPIDIAVLCAGIWNVMDVERLDAAMIRHGMEVNFGGTVSCLVPLAHRMMARRQGHIAVIASVAGYRGLPRSPAYAPTKAALINLVECLEPDLCRHGVSVSVINPGFVDTPMVAQNDFAMPFIIPVEEAGARIIAGLERGKFEIAFPWRMVAIMKTLRLLPTAVFLWLMRTYVARPPKSGSRRAD